MALAPPPDPTSPKPSFFASNAFKNVIAFLAFSASTLAAIFSYHAGQEAARATEAARQAEIRLRAIDQAIDRDRLASSLMSESLPYLERMRSDPPQSALRACHVVVGLATFQSEATNRSDIHELAQTLLDESATDPSGLCALAFDQAEFAALVATRQEQLIREAGNTDVEIDDFATQAEADIVSELLNDAAEPLADEIGTYHAILASYRSENCQLALEAANVFETIFNNELAQNEQSISVYRTTISDHYAVVIDNGDSQTDASDWVRRLRDEGESAQARIDNGTPESWDTSNTRFLTGAFVQENRGWVIDPSCAVQG